MATAKAYSREIVKMWGKEEVFKSHKRMRSVKEGEKIKGKVETKKFD